MPELWELRRTLAASVMPKCRIYLDLNYWNALCDAELGEARDAQAAELLEVLSECVNAGMHVCPIEQTGFLESVMDRRTW